MPIAANETSEYGTCPTIIRQPISGSDCTNFDSFEALMANESDEGYPCVIRGGVGFCSRSVSAIETDCEAE